jgi:hypothetical protein
MIIGIMFTYVNEDDINTMTAIFTKCSIKMATKYHSLMLIDGPYKELFFRIYGFSSMGKFSM